MGGILTKIRRGLDFKDRDKIPYVNAVILMSLFTFLFLCTEYLYVNAISHAVTEDKTVLAQNYALGVSAAGFFLYPLFNRFCIKKRRELLYAIIGAVSVLCMALVCRHMSYSVSFAAGLVLFLFLGLFGGAVFYISVSTMKTDRYLARTVGISYALGIMLQFANNNLVRSEIAEAVILSVFLLLLVWRLIKNDRICLKQDGQAVDVSPEEEEKKKDGNGKNVTGTATGILMVLLVVLMTFIFSTLDNAVTLVHANGATDIGQWPRILLALSGLSAGFIFDIKNRKYMGLVMYCVMILSTICIVILKFAGPFLAGLIIFYLSAGFFAVFFTSGFMELSRHMKLPELWAGMGRAVNNVTAAVIANPVLALLSSDSGIAVIVLVLVLFAAVSIVAAAYTVQKKNFMERPVTDAAEIDKKEKLRKLCETFSFTEREAEVFGCLVGTEDSVQTIAESLYVSRRTLERYISAIYEKTGVKSRIALLNLYNK